jgi:acyl-CoA synthetase (AMP-forming)/AMP-acid ligase II
LNRQFADPTFGCKTVVDLLDHRASCHGEQLAYRFLLDGDTAEATITYAELDKAARRVAAHLQRATRPGERALLLYPPGLDYIIAFYGCLYAGVVAVPAYPPNPARLDYRTSRIKAIVEDARPSIILTTSSIQALLMLAMDSSALQWLATDLEPGSDQNSLRPPAVTAEAVTAEAVTADTVAFLQYTSGSTASPKGVILTHGNIMYNSLAIYTSFEHTSEGQGVIWLPPYHDMGLIGGIIGSLFAGFPCTLMSPITFLQRPYLWLLAISRYRATTSGGPNFAYELCVRRVTDAQKATLDLSSWKVAMNGAEPVRADTMARFAEAFAPCGFRAEAFYPCYGLAEATLIVSGGKAGAPPVINTFAAAALERGELEPVPSAGSEARTIVGCGQPVLDQQVAIVDPVDMTRCPGGRVGEIWVRGPSVAQGYWDRAAESELTFRGMPADTEEGPFLRTGDLGFIWENELYVAGRLKDIIIVAGRKLHPEDIEQTVERSHPLLRPSGCAAFSVAADAADGEEELVIVQEVERHYHSRDKPEITTAIRRAVAAHHDASASMVVLIKPGRIPKTSSGKVQRHACRNAFLAGSLDTVA